MRGGAYRILEPLGRGGMGALYLAADTGAFDRKCVIKELLDYYDPTDPDEAREAQTRFETEARLLAELSHPGIPRIYSYFTEAGRHYIVMEYIEGETMERAVTHADPLGRVVPARPLAAEEVVRHAIRVCRVLEYLADQSTPVVHQDIKPANLIVDRNSGEVRLVDFGTARSRTQWATRARLDQGVSTAFGTAGYAAPEQYQGLSEPRSDVYGLAATVYHLLTDDDPGAHPFHFPQSRTLPGPLDHAQSRALHPEVRRRSSASGYRQALEAWLIPDEGSQPFVFRSGAVAHTTAELVALCDQHWPEARQHLADGDFDRWFRDRSRHDLAGKAKSARLESNADAALEAFLRRLDPRLAVPRLVVEPHSLDFGRVGRKTGNLDERRSAVRHLTLRNEGRGYAQGSFSASVPWIGFDSNQAGCLSGVEVPFTVWVDATALPLRRENQAIITCVPKRGARISIPAEVKLGVFKEAWGRLSAGLRPLGRLLVRGAQRGFSLWMRTLRNLMRSRNGVLVLVAETLALAAMMVVLWWVSADQSPDLLGLLSALFRALPLALVAAYLLPAFVLVGGAMIWEIAREVLGR